MAIHPPLRPSRCRKAWSESRAQKQRYFEHWRVRRVVGRFRTFRPLPIRATHLLKGPPCPSAVPSPRPRPFRPLLASKRRRPGKRRPCPCWQHRCPVAARRREGLEVNQKGRCGKRTSQSSGCDGGLGHILNALKDSETAEDRKLARQVGGFVRATPFMSEHTQTLQPTAGPHMHQARSDRCQGFSQGEPDLVERVERFASALTVSG